MLILQLIQNPIYFLSFALAFLISLSCHEAAHAYMANRLGDPTAKMMGRLTLNPFKHLDPWGTIFLFIVGFGWGIPVPINPKNFKNEKLDSLKVSLAGPATNLLLAFIFGLIYRFLPHGDIFGQIVIAMVSLNIIWMIFNLLPIPPLDGSHILRIFIPEHAYEILEKLGFPLLVVLLFFSPIINNIILWGLSIFFQLFTGHPYQSF